MAFCYTQISALLSHHQRSVLLQEMGGKRDPQPNIMQRKTLEHSSLNGMSPSNPFPELRERQGSSSRKNVKTRGVRGHQNHKALYITMSNTHMNSQRQEQHAQGLHRSAPGPLC